MIYMIAVNAKAIRAIEGIRGDILCGFFGAVLYYFLLVYFMWTGLEAIDLYRKLVIIFNKHNKRLVIYGGIICWGKTCKSDLYSFCMCNSLPVCTSIVSF